MNRFFAGGNTCKHAYRETFQIKEMEVKKKKEKKDKKPFYDY